MPIPRFYLLPLLVLLAACNPPIGERESFPEGFVWGAGSSGTTILGAAADHTSRLGLVRSTQESIAADVQLLQTIGLESYRFNLDWELLLTDSGQIDPEGIRYYEFLIGELGRAGIPPVVTLYSGPWPRSLPEAGGWGYPDTATRLAALFFESLGDHVSTWITVDDPLEDRVLGPARILREKMAAADTTKPNPALSRAPPFVQARRAAQRPGALDMPEDLLVSGFQEMPQLLMAHARMVQAYRRTGLPGRIGIAVGITPVYAARSERGVDNEVVAFVDGIFNRWLLDGLYKGAYPDEVLERMDLVFDQSDVAFIVDQGTDFLGINYFGPVLAEEDNTRMLGVRVLPNPDRDRAFRGQVLPQGMFDALVKVSSDYDRPPILITANGVGYGKLDEIVEQSRVRDELRLRFLRRHIVQVQLAILAGASVEGYYAWTAFDGTDPDRREGLIFVDFESRERLFKDSARLYSGVVRSNSVSRLPF